MQTPNENTFELPVKTNRLLKGGSLAFASMVLYTMRALQHAPAGTPFGTVIRWVIALTYILVGATVANVLLGKRRSYLCASQPPMFITERMLFGKLTTTRKQSLAGAAWVRVTSQSAQDSGPLCIEVGTHGYITTAIHCRDYSDKDILACKELCTRIAEFLKLEDKGYSHYDLNGVKHTE